MAKKTMVLALGGNSLVRRGQSGSFSEQLKNMSVVSGHIADLVNKEYRIAITHGNGPQVGSLLLQQEKAKPKMPLYVCVAETQGMIGYVIQESLDNKIRDLGLKTPVVTVLTQVLVSEKDPAFRNPTKPIGPFYKKRKSLPKKWKFVNTIKGFRRVVPSPKPKRIIEADIIKKILPNAIVIACGGGGIPVIDKKGLQGIDAVIDKDLSSERLASSLNADLLVMLTDVDYVYLNFKRSNQKKLKKVSLEEIKSYYTKGHFPPGSMGPKMLAAIKFLDTGRSSKKKRKVIITSFPLLEKALEGNAGTVIDA
jgi:carbamate kinase